MTKKQHSGSEFDAAVDKKVAEELAQIIEETEKKAERQKILDRLTALEENIETFAQGYRKLADSVGEVEEGQLSKSSRAKVAGYSAGGGGAIMAIVQIIQYFL